MTLDEVSWLMRGFENMKKHVEEEDERDRYRQMSPEVQRRADALKEKYGAF